MTKRDNLLTRDEVYFRGIFMSIFIDIEFLLGDTLARLIVNDNDLYLNVVEFINPKLLLDSKITLLNKVLKKKYPKLYNKYKSDLATLRNLSSLRNDFAHKKIEVDKDAETINFLVFDNGKIILNSHKYYDLEDKFTKLKSIMKVINQLDKETRL